MATTLEKDAGWGAAQAVKHLVRDAEAEADDYDLLYGRDAEAEPEDDDLLSDVYGRDADAKVNCEFIRPLLTVGHSSRSG